MYIKPLNKVGGDDMLLTTGPDTIELSNEIQIRAYLASGYSEVTEDNKKSTRPKNTKAKS